jgi:hypothetical protein
MPFLPIAFDNFIESIPMIKPINPKITGISHGFKTYKEYSEDKLATSWGYGWMYLTISLRKNDEKILIASYAVITNSPDRTPMIMPITVHFLRYTRSRVVQSNLPTNLSIYLDKFNLIYGHCDDIIG